MGSIELIVLAAFVGLFAFAGIFGMAYALIGRLTSVEDRVRQLRLEQQGPATTWQQYAEGWLRVFKRLGEMIPRSADELSRLERRLVQAGIRRKDGPLLFVGVQVALGVSLLVAAGVTGHLASNTLLSIMLAVFLGAALPDLWLAHQVRRRKERIQLALPDALDLQVICVEAGLGLDQSLMRIGQEIRRSHKDLSDELHLLTLEVSAGKSRAEALRNMSRRTEVEDLKSLVAVLIQTDRFGTSIADSLRVFSDSLRTKRRQRAEEAAAKMGVKMIPPLFIFVLPATFVVVVGPAIIGIATGLLPWLSSPVK